MSYLLIVDDDEDFSSAIAEVLRAEGHEVGLKHDTKSALENIQQRRPDAVVLDVMFPESPSAGFDLARALRRENNDLPILMLTAVNQQFPLGFSSKDIDPKWLPITEFSEKPVDFRILLDKVTELLKKSQTH